MRVISVSRSTEVYLWFYRLVSFFLLLNHFSNIIIVLAFDPFGDISFCGTLLPYFTRPKRIKSLYLWWDWFALSGFFCHFENPREDVSPVHNRVYYYCLLFTFVIFLHPLSFWSCLLNRKIFQFCLAHPCCLILTLISHPYTHLHFHFISFYIICNSSPCIQFQYFTSFISKFSRKSILQHL